MSVIGLPKTMRALLFDQPARILKLNSSWPIPNPKFDADEHLLKVHYIAITKQELTWPFPPETYKDYSPGVEMSGTVVSCPRGSRYPVGSEIYMRTTSPRSGSAREYCIGLGSELALRPKNLTAEQAAAIPVSALTAWQALFVQAGFAPPITEHIQKRSNFAEQKKKVLIIGASGSVGMWATQLAHAAGIWVAGTCHTRNVEIVRQFGANEVIDYTKTSLHQWMKDQEINTDNGNKLKDNRRFDLVLDCVGGPNAVDAWYAADPNHGLVLSIVPPDDMAIKWTLDRRQDISRNVSGRFFIMTSDGEQLQEITKWVGSGRVKPTVDSVYELEDFKRAFERVDSGLTTGKVVVRI